MPQRLPPYSVPNGNGHTCLRCVDLLLVLGQPTLWRELGSLLARAALLSWVSTISCALLDATRPWPTTTPCAPPTRRLGHLRLPGGKAHGLNMRDGSSCCSRGLRLHGAHAFELLQPWQPPTAALLALLVYIRGKGGTNLAQMLVWYSFFPQASPINGLC